MELNENDPGQGVIIRDCVEISLAAGIVNVLYRDHAEIDAAIKHEMHLAFLEITGGKRHPFIFESEGVLWYTREGREYAREIEHLQPFLAVAMVAPGLGFRLLADFYARLYKPIVPYQVFKSRDEAVQWLKSF